MNRIDGSNYFCLGYRTFSLLPQEKEPSCLFLFLVHKKFNYSVHWMHNYKVAAQKTKTKQKNNSTNKTKINE